MHKKTLRHGCLATLCVLTTAQGAEPRLTRIQTRVLDVEYAVNDDALPLDTVQMWYTLDEGRSWQAYGYDEDRQSPMRFRAEILGRPENERPYLLIPVGYPAEEALVPDIEKKRLDEVASFI